ncbi:acetyltransferase [Humitalea sp. 24SJ18S-53]|uniref:acetyltransferase n=1 Tax=Humitalea sp. 24SJ18S-53 TaxID=3422307 RepID=UPI003D665065
MAPCLVLGTGAHAAVLVEALRAQGLWEPVGLVGPAPPGREMGVAWLGDVEILPRLRAEGIAAGFVAIGDNATRQRQGDVLAGAGFALPVAVHPAAWVSPSASLGDGAMVLVRAVVGTGSQVGRLCIINSGAIVDHDNRIHEAAHIAPGCALSGDVTVGARTLVGVGSAVRPGITIGRDAVVGAGSAVVRDVADGARVGGAPARELR